MPKERIFELIKSNVYAVVSTSNRAGHPESALVGVSETENYELVFATNDNTRKIENIRNNPNVAIVIGGADGSLKSVQIEGVARIIAAEDALDYAENHYKKIPSAKDHFKDKGECFIVITPLWARYTSFDSKSPDIFEEHFDAD